VDIPGYMQGAPLFGERKATRKVTDKIPGRQVETSKEEV
jgi:hypothetical protein